LGLRIGLAIAEALLADRRTSLPISHGSTRYRRARRDARRLDAHQMRQDGVANEASVIAARTRLAGDGFGQIRGLVNSAAEPFRGVLDSSLIQRL
jgi:NAD(P)-dependent dehydrogenase (short-subunit alcohol dehydrogenase family)